MNGGLKTGACALGAGLVGCHALDTAQTLLWWAGAKVTPIPFYVLIGTGGALIAWNLLPEQRERVKYEKLYKSMGLVRKDGNRQYLPKLISKFKAKDTVRLLFTLPMGLSTDDFERHNKAFCQALKAEEVQIRYINGKVEMILKLNQLADKYPFELTETKNLTEIVIGHSKDGLMTLTLDDSYTHLLVGGITGYGKSTFLLQMLTHLILTKDPEDLQISISDLKRIDLPVFERCKHINMYADTIEDTTIMLKTVQKEMYRRLQLLKKAEVNHINEYRGHLPRHIVVIDEFATLMEAKLFPLIQDIISKSRAVGIHFIICTQRPDREVLPGLIKANLPATLAFKVRNEVNSRILLDNSKAAELTAKGRGILQTDSDTEVQVMLITPSQVRKMVKHTYEAKTEPANTEGVISLADFQRYGGDFLR